MEEQFRLCSSYDKSVKSSRLIGNAGWWNTAKSKVHLRYRTLTQNEHSALHIQFHELQPLKEGRGTRIDSEGGSHSCTDGVLILANDSSHHLHPVSAYLDVVVSESRPYCP